MIDKLKSRTEWQAFIIAVVVMFANRFLEIGLTDSDLWGMWAGVSGYGVSRGLAKTEVAVEPPAAELSQDTAPIDVGDAG